MCLAWLAQHFCVKNQITRFSAADERAAWISLPYCIQRSFLHFNIYGKQYKDLHPELTCHPSRLMSTSSLQPWKQKMPEGCSYYDIIQQGYSSRWLYGLISLTITTTPETGTILMSVLRWRNALERWNNCPKVYSSYVAKQKLNTVFD